MIEFLPGPQYYATEIFDKNIEWGRSVFPEVIYLHQRNYPPLDFPDGKFDMIYAYSIFTHFEENLHLQWISELHRVLKKRGLIILTIHGEPILRRCKDEAAVREAMCAEDQDYQKLCERFYDYGYAFYTCYDRARLSTGGLDSEIFGITYISKAYIQENWSRKFRLIEHDEGAIINWQDWVVMRKL
jgi:SAM-dependent methyltransferase